MAAAVAEQVWRDSAPEAVEGELSALWRDVGRRRCTLDPDGGVDVQWTRPPGSVK